MGTRTQDSTGTTLSTKEQTRLDVLETKIAMAVNGFAEAGAALREIRDSRLYRHTHKTFDAYAQEVWGLRQQNVDRLIRSGSVQEVLNPIGLSVPSESIARELSPLKDKPAELIGAWQRAQEEHDGKPTAAQVRAIVSPSPPAAEAISAKSLEVIDPPDAVATPVKALPAPRAERQAGRSSSSLASVTRAVNSALDDGWTLEEIADSIQRTYAGRAT